MAFAQPQTTVVVNKYVGRAGMTAKSGRPDRVTTSLTTSSGIILKSQRVYLQYRVYGTTTWKTQASWLTNAYRDVSVTVQPKKKMYYRWYYAGTAQVAGVYSSSAYFTYSPRLWGGAPAGLRISWCAIPNLGDGPPDRGTH